MENEERIIAEVTNDYEVMIELALKGYINLGFEIRTMEKFIDSFENLYTTQEKINFDGKVNIDDGFYCPDNKTSYSFYRLTKKINRISSKSNL